MPVCVQRAEPGCHDESVTVENVSELSTVSQLLKVGRIINVKSVHISSQEPLSVLRSVICHLRSQCVTFHLTQVNVPCLNPSQVGRPVLDLPPS